MFDSFRDLAIAVFIFIIVFGTLVGFVAAIVINVYSAFLCLGIVIADVFLWKVLNLISK